MSSRIDGVPRHVPTLRPSPVAVTALLAMVALLVASGAPTAGAGAPAPRQNPTCFGQAATIVARPGTTTVGTSGNDVIVGTPGDDLIFTGGGRTLVCSRGGDDIIYGGAGPDRIRSGRGNDLVFGVGGRDRILGGPGSDRIDGGDGRDTILGGRGADWCDSGSGPGTTRACRSFSTPSPPAPRADGAMVTFTFDDGTKSNPRIAAPALEAAGFRGTFYLMSGFLDEDPYLDTREARMLHRRGHEVGGHTISHPYLTQLSDAELRSELEDSKTTLERVIGAPVTAFAAPYGDIDARVLDAIDDLYTSNRTVLPGFNFRGSVPRYELLVRSVTATTPVSTVEGWLDDAAAQNAWVILTYHDILDVPTTYDTTPAAIRAHIEAVTERNLPVVTVTEGLAVYAG